MERDGSSVQSSDVPSGEASAVAASARPAGPHYFSGAFHHAVDTKNRLVLPAPFRSRLSDGAYLGPLDGYLGLWPEDGFEAVLSRWEDGKELGIVSQEVYDAFLATTYWVQPDSQGRIVVHKDLRAFADIEGPVTIVGADKRIAVWAADRWERYQSHLPEGRDAALRQATRDLRL